MGVTCETLYAPAVVETEELREQIIGMSNISAVLKEGSISISLWWGLETRIPCQRWNDQVI